ncbi:replication-relaxation family protein [Niallia sp. FSL R7-0271]|uniref:replication-relaxation family protein n=1 Tax=Niallia sp. FSL R7-0271 TaxID=2921678 RepID=UPI0030F73CCB
MDNEHKVWYSIKHTKKGAWINSKDLELLQLIYTNRILTLKQIKRYGRYILNVPESTIKSKLKRWFSNDIVSLEYLSTLGKPVVSCYKIGKYGFQILQNEGVINDEELLEVTVKNIKQPSHYFGIQDVVIDTLIEMKDKRSTITSTHPNYKTYSSSENMLNKETIIIPDWKIATTDKKILNIEFDTGYQNLSKIKEKVDSYMELATTRPEEHHFILFVVADNKSETYTTEYPANREIRIVNIKQLIGNKVGNKVKNLDFYVCSAYRAPSIASNILKGIYPITQSQKESELELAMLSVQLNDDVDYTISPIEASEFYLSDVPDELYGDSHHAMVDHLNNKKLDVIFNIVEEGSVNAFDRLSYLETLISSKRMKREVEQVYALYLSTAAMQNDVLPKDFKHISFSQTQVWHYKKIDSPSNNKVVRVLE